MAIFRPALSCFFCLSAVNPPPRNPSSFRCPHCACWNRYDASGEFYSDEPAMHDESLNPKPLKRASPSKDRLPTVYAKSPFCHTCQTNQMLLVNLLANYLPSPENPEYAKRVEMLPEYQDSLHLRYPPVCDSCLPLVEEEIKDKDNMARTKALGGWLKESKGKGKQRRVSGADTVRRKIGREFWLWRFRGCLWVATLALSLVGNSIAASGRHPPHQLTSLLPALPMFTLISILWTVWDPTYSSLRNAQLQGRDMRQRGKHTYIVLQMSAWFSRLLTSTLLCLSWHLPHLNYLRPPALYFSACLAIEIFILIASSVTLRLQQPPPIRLINTNSHKLLSARQTPDPILGPAPQTSPTHPDPDFLAALSLSSKPVITTTNPIFGHPSLLSTLPSLSPSGKHEADEDDADAMDWTPTNPSAADKRKRKPSAAAAGASDDDDGSWLRPQRFFPPEKPTGLESLMERTELKDDTGTSQNRNNNAHIWNWWWVYAVSLIPLVGVAYRSIPLIRQ